MSTNGTVIHSGQAATSEHLLLYPYVVKSQVLFHTCPENTLLCCFIPTLYITLLLKIPSISLLLYRDSILTCLPAYGLPSPITFSTNDFLKCTHDQEVTTLFLDTDTTP
jgi:hypothetical protein